MIGAEADLLSVFDGLAAQSWRGSALFLGPTFHYQISEKVDLSGAWTQQLAGGPGIRGAEPRRVHPLAGEVAAGDRFLKPTHPPARSSGRGSHPLRRRHGGRQRSVWFITGCSTGFGREFAKLVMARGDRLVATARDASRVRDLAQGDRALALDLDVTDAGQISRGRRRGERKIRPHRRARQQRRLRLPEHGRRRRRERKSAPSSTPTCSACSRSPAPCCR